MFRSFDEQIIYIMRLKSAQFAISIGMHVARLPVGVVRGCVLRIQEAPTELGWFFLLVLETGCSYGAKLRRAVLVE